jgi:hypothetical protein
VGVFEASEGTRNVGTLRLLEIKVVKLVSSDAPATARSANIMKRLVVLSCSSRLRRDESQPVALAGTEACSGGAILRRLVFSVEIDLVALSIQPH